MNYLDMEKILSQKMNCYNFQLRFENLILKIKFFKNSDELSKILEEINKLNIRYQIEKINELKYNIKFEKESYIEFQKQIIRNADRKWVIEIIRGDFYWEYNSDKTRVEFETEKRYFDNETDAMIEYWNISSYKSYTDNNKVVLFPKQILYFDI